jgi:hypothetical protein
MAIFNEATGFVVSLQRDGRDSPGHVLHNDHPVGVGV